MKYLIIFLLLFSFITPVLANTVIIYEEGWYSTILLPENNELNIQVYYDENNQTEIVGADVIIFSFLPSLVNDIYVTTDTYTYMCSIDRQTGILYNNYTFHVQYTDIYGNNYDNYTSDKTLYFNSGILEYELGIDRSGLYLKKPVLYVIKDYVYTYEYPLEIGWLNANITSTIDYNYESFYIKYRVVKLDEYDTRGKVFNTIQNTVSKYVPFGNEFIAILSAFSTVLKFSIQLLIRLVMYPLYVLIILECIFMGHSLVVGKTFMAVLQTFIIDNYYTGCAIIGLFKGLILFIVDLIKMLKPFG